MKIKMQGKQGDACETPVIRSARGLAVHRSWSAIDAAKEGKRVPAGCGCSVSHLQSGLGLFHGSRGECLRVLGLLTADLDWAISAEEISASEPHRTLAIHVASTLQQQEVAP